MAGEVAGDFKPWGDPTNWRDPALGINRSPEGFGGPLSGRGEPPVRGRLGPVPEGLDRPERPQVLEHARRGRSDRTRFLLS